MKQILFAFLILLSHNSIAWDNAKDIKTTPFFGGVTLTAEYKNYLIDFSAGAPLRHVRLKGVGMFNSFTTEDCQEIGERLIKRLENTEEFKLQGLNGHGNPVYFSHNLYYLISIEPNVIAIVPYHYPFEHVFSKVNEPYSINDEFYGQYGKYKTKERAAGLNHFSTPLKGWLNHLELSSIIPDVEGVEIIYDEWKGSVPLKNALENQSFPFTVVVSSRFPKHQEFIPRVKVENTQ